MRKNRRVSLVLSYWTCVLLLIVRFSQPRKRLQGLHVHSQDLAAKWMGKRASPLIPSIPKACWLDIPSVENFL